MSRYPGDEFVDILGFDHYEFIGDAGAEEAGVQFAEELKRSLTYMNQLAKDHQKIMCLSETGLESLPDPNWWCGVLYPAIKDFPIEGLQRIGRYRILETLTGNDFQRKTG